MFPPVVYKALIHEKQKSQTPWGFDMSYSHLQAWAFRALLSGPPFWVNSSILSNGLQNRRLWGGEPTSPAYNSWWLYRRDDAVILSYTWWAFFSVAAGTVISPSWVTSWGTAVDFSPTAVFHCPKCLFLCMKWLCGERCGEKRGNFTVKMSKNPVFIEKSWKLTLLFI